MTFKNPLLLFIAALLCSTSFGQTYEGAAAKALIPLAKTVKISELSPVPSFIVFEEEHQMTVEEFKRWEQSTFQYEDGLSFKTRKTVDQKTGTIHIFRDQFFQGVPIEHGLSVIHHRDGRVVYTNGSIHSRIGIPTTPRLTENDVTRTALKQLGIDQKKWQETVAHCQHLEGDHHSGHGNRLENTLIIYPHEGQYFLAWKTHILSTQFNTYNYVYTDAQSGKILKVLEAAIKCDPGTGETTYRGTQEILAEDRILEFILHNDCGTADITTKAASGQNISDDDNIWNSNNNIDRAGITAHFGVTGAYNYFETVHTQVGMDGGEEDPFENVKATVDVTIREQFDNAQYLLGTTELEFGMGADDNIDNDDITTPDICGHEFAHGVLYMSGGITNLDNHETNALHEGMADIFGDEVEAFIDGAELDWIHGDEVAGTSFRSLSNPNSDIHPEGPAGSADTYLGNYWTGDRPHNDGGVIRFWYHLLSEGGSGVNDNGQAFEVDGIGHDAAAEILYKAVISGAFGTSPNYDDARNATIQGAIEVAKGEFCSAEVGNVINAWHAVGVGDKVHPDVSLSGLNITNANGIPVGGTFYAYFDLEANADYLFDQETPVGFYIRSYCVGSNGLSSPFSVKIGQLECGNAVSNAAFLALPSSIPAGNYYLMAKADAYNEVTETNELNNSMCIPITIIEPVVLPDFVIQTPSVSPSEVDAGSSFNISYRLHNQGTGYGGYTVTCFYLSTDATHSPNDVSLGGSFANGLLPGGSIAGGGSLTIPGGTVPGEYFIILHADCYEWREELDEINNYAAVPITVTGLTGPLPDLAIHNVDPSPETGPPPLKAPGSWMSVRYDLVNLFGGVNPSPTVTTLFLSTDGTLSMDDQPIVTANNQLPGPKTAVFQIPNSAQVNQVYRIIIVADYNSDQAELLENNNVGIGHVKVGSPFTGGDPEGGQPALESTPSTDTRTNLRIFPNPTRDQFTVAYAVQKEPISVSIFNSTGQQLQQLSIEEAAQTGQWQYNGEQLPTGIYYIQWQVGEAVELLKLVVE